jgi:hypothetical protein
MNMLGNDHELGGTMRLKLAAAALATGAFTFNATPTNGSRACFASTQTQTAVTFTGATGQTVVGTPVASAYNIRVLQ